MKAIESPKKSSNIVTESTNALSNILLPLNSLNSPALKNKVSKTETNSTKSILPDRIYVDVDTTFYKDFSVQCLGPKEKGEGFHHNLLFQTKFFLWLFVP